VVDVQRALVVSTMVDDQQVQAFGGHCQPDVFDPGVVVDPAKALIVGRDLNLAHRRRPDRIAVPDAAEPGVDRPGGPQGLQRPGKGHCG